MADMSMSEAAKWAGVTRATIHKAITRTGANRLSATKDDIGQWRIDPAELARLYKPATHGKPANDTPESSPDIAELMAGKDREIRLLRELADKAEARADDLAKDRDHWREQAETQTRMLTHQKDAGAIQLPAGEPVKRSGRVGRIAAAIFGR